MRPVKDRHFALFIGLDIVDDTHIQRQLIETQLAGQRSGPLDNKQIEVLGGIEESVLIAGLRLKGRHFIARIAGHNAIHQGGTEGVRRGEPVDKVLRQLPLGGIAQDQGLQRLTVIIDQFAGDNHPSLIGCAGEMLVTLKQQAG